MEFARLIMLVLPLLVAPASVTLAPADPGAPAAGVGTASPEELGPRDSAEIRTVAAPRNKNLSKEGLGKGVFLIASESLNDPNFSQTVVLLLEYDKNGAVGLIINRPTEISLASLLPEEKNLRDRRELVFIGGPVGRAQLFLLLRSTTRPEHSQRIVDEVYATTSLETLREIIAKESPVAFQAYAGYSGWGPGQLDAELMRGDWLVTPADSETVFDKATDTIWHELIRKNKGLWVQLSLDYSLLLALDPRLRVQGVIR